MADKATDAFIKVIKANLGCVTVASEVMQCPEDIKEKNIKYDFPVQELKDISAVVEKFLAPALSQLKNQIVYDVFEGKTIFPAVCFQREYNVRTDKEIHIISYFVRE